MTLADKTVLVTGANRGLGRALVTEALRRGASRVYAGTRGPLTHADPRVTPLMLDVTDPAHVRAAAEAVAGLDVLVNNAGLGLFDDLTDRDALERHLAVNLFGPYGVTLAMLPALTEARGAIVNVLSLAAVAAVPVMPSYSVSKAAALSLTQSLRALLAAKGVRVHAALVGPIDTDMSRDLEVPKTPADAVARALLDGVDAGEEEIFPDRMAQYLAGLWPEGPTKVLERQNAALVPA